MIEDSLALALGEPLVVVDDVVPVVEDHVVEDVDRVVVKAVDDVVIGFVEDCLVEVEDCVVEVDEDTFKGLVFATLVNGFLKLFCA